jgi:PTH1 family peptidyl-tRNA hydrolase
VILVVGLGNPGPRYAVTRHNVGFRVADRLVTGHNASFRDKFQGQVADIDIADKRVLVLKPMTYMNESGRSVVAAMSFYKLFPAELLVVNDELDLPLGEVRLKAAGGDAGHRGVRSICEQLGTADFARVRLGIGRPPPEFGGSGADYVLQAFPLADQALAEEMVARGAEAVELVMSRGMSAAMNTINQRAKR